CRPDVNELAQSLRDLFHAAFQILFNRRRIGRCQLDGQAAGEFYLIRIAPHRLCLATHIFESVKQTSRRNSDEIRKPRIAIPGSAALGVHSLAADPDRQPGFLIGLWVESDILDSVVSTVKINVLFGPEAL